MTLKNGEGEHQFNNINREEQSPLEEFFKGKQLRIKNDLADDVVNTSPLLFWHLLIVNSLMHSWPPPSMTMIWMTMLEPFVRTVARRMRMRSLVSRFLDYAQCNC